MCRVCGKRLKLMTSTHLKTHGITAKEYRDYWPDAPLSSGYHKKNIVLGQAGAILKFQIDGSEPEDFVVCRMCKNIYHRITHKHLNGPICQKYQKKLGIHITSLKTYKIQFPNAPTVSFLSSQKLIDTRIKKYGHGSGWSNPTAVAVTLSKSLTLYWQNISPEEREKYGHRCSEILKRAWKTRRINDPNNESYQKLLKTREKNHPNFLQNSLFKGSRKPNLSESKLISILTPLGFRYNGKGPVKIAHHFPDFVHTKYPLLIEYDGPGGHDPNSPRVPSNQPDLDDLRDQAYKNSGYEILRILLIDLKTGKSFIQQKVKEWMISLGYSTEWELFDIREWFQ